MALNEQISESKSRGLTILGTDLSCGKTVFATGLAAMLKRQIAVRAVKPICGKSGQSELSFISTITCTPIDYAPSMVGSPARLYDSQWQDAIASTRALDALNIVEAPCAIATPFYVYQGHALGDLLLAGPDVPCDFIYDPCQFALDVGYPVVLVTSHTDTTLEKLITAHGMALSRKLGVIGLVSVETTEAAGRDFERKYSRMDVELTLQERTLTPYLGCIKHSQAIDVHQIVQGNLIKMTEGGLDLLSLFKKLAL